MRTRNAEYVRGTELLKSPELEKLMNAAYREWWFKSGYCFTESPYLPFESADVGKAIDKAKSAGGWLKLTRSNLKLSTTGAAKRCGVSRAAYQKFEAGEIDGVSSIKTFSRIADALGMEFVYALRPKLYPSRAVWKSLESEVLNLVAKGQIKRCAAPRALANIAIQIAKTRKARSRNGWTERSDAQRLI